MSCDLLWLLPICILIGWLAGVLSRGHGFGLLGNVLLGIVGVIAGSVLFRIVGLYATGWLGTIVTGVAGGIIVLAAFRWAQRRGVASDWYY